MKREKPEVLLKKVTDVVELYTINDQVCETLIKAAKEGYDLCEYAINGMDEYQLCIIAECIKYNLDVSKVANVNFSYEQMSELCSAMKKGVDVSDYANEMLTPIEMYGVTVSKLTSKNTRKFFLDDFNNDQLYEILMGIENGLDVSTYAKVEISANDMTDIRLELMQSGSLTKLNVF